jgi:hypothetical protein
MCVRHDCHSKPLCVSKGTKVCLWPEVFGDCRAVLPCALAQVPVCCVPAYCTSYTDSSFALQLPSCCACFMLCHFLCACCCLHAVSAPPPLCLRLPHNAVPMRLPHAAVCLPPHLCACAGASTSSVLGTRKPWQPRQGLWSCPYLTARAKGQRRFSKKPRSCSQPSNSALDVRMSLTHGVCACAVTSLCVQTLTTW